MLGSLLRLGGDWWRLPGPDRWLQRVVAAADRPSGVVGLAMPSPEPEGWVEAVSERLDERTSSEPIAVDASAGLGRKGAIRLLASAAGLETAGLRVISQFLEEPSLADSVFVIHSVPEGDWREWSLFLRTFRAERLRGDRPGAPTVVIAAHPNLPPDEVQAALGERPVRWMGVVSRLDTRLYVEAIGGRQDDTLVGRVAMETVVELAGWDRPLAAALTRLEPEERIDPLHLLAEHARHLAGVAPSWSNGLVDLWDGQPHVSTLALIAAGDERALRARLWSARVKAIFPFLNTVRAAIAARHEAALRARLPIKKTWNTREELVDDPQRLEWWDIKTLLEDSIPRDELLLIDDCLKLRRAMAHEDPSEGWRIVRTSRRWEAFEADFSAASAGWDWPRCGQKLTMLIGPSCAGKSTYAQANYAAADIISSDAIREQIFGSVSAAGDQAPVFERLRAEVRSRLASGRRVVVDATHIKVADRLATARLMPPDMPVEYVVLDRPHADKVATAGWRAERPGLLESHAETFRENLEAILAGDGLANVTVKTLLPKERHLGSEAA